MSKFEGKQGFPKGLMQKPGKFQEGGVMIKLTENPGGLTSKRYPQQGVQFFSGKAQYLMGRKKVLV